MDVVPIVVVRLEVLSRNNEEKKTSQAFTLRIILEEALSANQFKVAAGTRCPVLNN